MSLKRRARKSMNVRTEGNSKRRDANAAWTLTGFRAERREAEDAIAVSRAQRFQKSARLGQRSCPQHGRHRNFRDAIRNARAPRSGFVQTHARQLGVGEHAVRNQPIARRARLFLAAQAAALRQLPRATSARARARHQHRAWTDLFTAARIPQLRAFELRHPWSAALDSAVQRLGRLVQTIAA